jgi:periplasmic copper chaperone A
MKSTMNRRHFAGLVAVTAAALRAPAAFAHNDATPEAGHTMAGHDGTPMAGGHANAAGSGTGALFFTVSNGGATADRLVAAKASVAKLVEIHEMATVGNVMTMAPLADGLEIPAGGSVELKPGGYHVMMFGLRQDLNAGDQFEATIVFETAGDLTLPVPVIMKAEAEAMPPTETYTVGDLTVTAVWARPAPALLGEIGPGVAGAFLTVTNGADVDDVLEMAEATVSQVTEIHEMKKVGDVMEMAPVPDGLPAPAGETVQLMPGGYHLMLIGLLKDLKVGDRFGIDLHFTNAGHVTVEAVVMELEDGKAYPPTESWEVGQVTVSGVWSRPAPAMVADDSDMDDDDMDHDMHGDDGHDDEDDAAEATPTA